MLENYPKEWKTLWEKEKLLVMSNFSFSQSVFKRLVLQTLLRMTTPSSMAASRFKYNT